MAHVLSPQQAALCPTGEVPGWLESVDPRLRIVVASVYAIAVVAGSRLDVLALAFVFSMVLLLAAHLPLRQTLTRMAAMDGFILFMLVILPFSVSGDPVFTIWGLTASWQGIALAVEIALTANAVVLALLVLVGTMEPVTLGYALHALKMPEKLVHLLMFSIRYIGVLREEYLRLRTAMKVRGFRPGTNWHTYRSFGYLVGMMLVRAVERSERILGAMKCRGFSGRIVLLQQVSFTRSDAAFVAIALIATSALVALEFLA
ncbi:MULTISPECIES: cobalt ECF transporter T component CbiQ [unclassified Ectothiorhodospira]|uniref:cobalt ECF transporter T component CbiQ n=1 Tax=unclassified Ectothiorhodospira TaxID=2684909 RepID=UPI001EE882E5|nr:MULTISPECIES: cobalt ECF transporter T component CbiQ [unclassified Ectothiorhodospira]MCG5517281.1 cobalt ECF transporter T component CbiQ [Ectothiorhodospira sp. 9100]MCG5520171.1 cobalt ECF transporter T component CbiQ [Ectothiorhodospira sp. 9905]